MTQLNVAMCDDRIAILADPNQEFSAGGIALVNAKVDKAAIIGTVAAAGPGKRNFQNWKERIPNNAKVGDKVVFSEYAGNVSVIGGVKYHILRSEDLLAVLPVTVVE
jgi:chaperonin GroES